MSDYTRSEIEQRAKDEVNARRYALIRDRYDCGKSRDGQRVLDALDIPGNPVEPLDKTLDALLAEIDKPRPVYCPLCCESGERLSFQVIPESVRRWRDPDTGEEVTEVAGITHDYTCHNCSHEWTQDAPA